MASISPSMRAPMPAPATPYVPYAEPSGPLAAMGLALLAFYLFLAYSRVVEILATKFGALPIMLPVMLVVLLASVLTGGLMRFRAHPVVGLMAAYYAWMLFCVPFSIWKGGSVGIVLYQLKMALVFVAIVSLLRTTANVRTMMLSIGLSMIVLVIIGNNVSDDGTLTRFQFEAGSLSNPNELANHFLIGLPLAWITGAGRNRFSVKALVRLGVLVSALIILAKTGSRGGFLIAIIMGITLLLTFTFANKVKLLIIGTLGLFLAVAVSPRSAIERYRTIMGDSDGPRDAIASRASRGELLKASISITLRNPIFGVGPANFVVAFNDDLKEEGRHHHWEVTHNAYTQMSSEMGIPSLLFYLACFGVAIKRVLAVRRASRKVPQLRSLFQMSSLLLLSIVAYLASGLFTSNAHQFYFPMLIGLALIIDYAGNADIRAFQMQMAQAPQPWNPDVAPVSQRMPSYARRREIDA
jgi:O-antigen ligase